LGADAVCNGDSIALTASSGFAGYQWSNGGDSSSVSVFNSDVYCVTATHATGCTVTDCKEIGDVLHENIAIFICEGNSYFGYTQAGIYIDTIQDAGCVTERTLNLTVNPLPEAVITVDSLLDSVVLTASGGNSYIWNTGQTASSITAYQPSSYCVTVSNSNGCQDSTCFLFTDISSETNGNFGVAVIPNVASYYTNLIIFSSQSGAMEVSVYTSSGQLVAVRNVEVTSSPFSVPLDLSGYAEGVYVVRVKNQNDVVARRLVVVR
jgi:hypothetical protein